MPLDAICLRAVTNELNNVLAGCRVEKVYQPDRDEIVLQTRGGQGGPRRLLLSIFLDPATDAASIAQGADFLSVMGFAYIIAAVMNSYLNVLRGAGDVNVSLVAGLFEMGARLAFASLLAPHLGVWGIWLATPLSWASGCIIPVVRYYSKEWMKRTLI